MAKDLSKFLKKARIQIGLSQKEISTKLGYSTPQFISNWERGLSYPPYAKLKSLSTILKVDHKVLMEKIISEKTKAIENSIRSKIS